MWAWVSWALGQVRCFFTCCSWSQSARQQPSRKRRWFMKWLWLVSYILKQAGLPGGKRGIRWMMFLYNPSFHTLQVTLKDWRNIPGNWHLHLEDDNLCYYFLASPWIQGTPGGGRYAPPSLLLSHICLLSPAATFVSSSRQMVYHELTQWRKVNQTNHLTKLLTGKMQATTDMPGNNQSENLKTRKSVNSPWLWMGQALNQGHVFLTLLDLCTKPWGR